MKLTRLFCLTCLGMGALCLLPATSRAEWVLQHSMPGDGNDVTAISAIDDDIAAAVGISSQGGNSQPLVLSTKNGGAQWAQGSLPGQFSFVLTLVMTDPKTVYGGGLGLYKSSNGGQTYAAVTAPGLSGFTTIMGLDAPNPNYAYAVSESNVFYTNNGLQWQKTATGIAPELVGVDFIDSTTGWVCGGLRDEIKETDPFSGQEKVVGYNIRNDGVVMRSTDAGKTFEPMTIGAPCYFSAITFADANIGIAVAQSNDKPYFLRRTTDAGRTWTDVALPVHPYGAWQYLTKVVMLNPLKGFAAGSVGVPEGGYGNKAVVISTADGGSTWSLVSEAERQGVFYSITFPCEHTGWVSGNFGQIVKFQDGIGCKPYVGPGEDAITGEDGYGDAVEQDLFSWGSVFGTFGEDTLISAGSAPGKPEEDTGGSGPIIGPGEKDCREVTTTGDCSTRSGSSAGLLLLVFLTLVLASSRWLRRRGTIALTLVCVMAFGVSCGSEQTSLVCDDPPDSSIPSTLPDLAVPNEDTGNGGSSFACGLPVNGTPTSFSNTERRHFDSQNLIVFVRQHAHGGSDLYVTTEDGKQTAALTAFDSPEVEVLYPSWSPDRTHIAFVSNYRSDFNVKPYNVFVLRLDGSACYQVSPDIPLAMVADSAAQTASVIGTFRFGIGAVANPVPGARVTHTRGTTSTTTGAGGEFLVTVPPGEGRIVVRGQVNGVTIVGSADYSAADGEEVYLEAPVVGTAQPPLSFGLLMWSTDSQYIYTMITEQLKLLHAVEVNSGAMETLLQSAEDSVTTFAPMPLNHLIAVSYRSTPEAYRLLDIEKPEKPVYTFDFPGQTGDSIVAVSPQHFLASVQGSKLVVLGAESDGEIGLRDVNAPGLSGVVPGQMDWSLTGDKLVVTVATGARTNLLVVDVNTNTAKAITTDGASRMPAWAGR
jgi:photosystem II stability/assembly factor-like uncharacterized protein